MRQAGQFTVLISVALLVVLFAAFMASKAISNLAHFNAAHECEVC